MSKWIRWWGIVAFVVIVGIFSAIWYLLADKLIERNIEKTGEYIVGAEVEIGKADLSIIPLGITLSDMTIADPSSPMRNMFEVENIQFHLDGKYLFERKIIIQDMVIEGLKFNTKRERSGEIKDAAPLTANKIYEDFIVPVLDLSKLETFIEQEEIQSIKHFEYLVYDINRVKNEWVSAAKQLPTESDLGKYRERSAKIYSEIESNKVSGLISNAKNIKKLKDDIERDIDDINLNITAMQIDLDSLTEKKQRALKAIDRDYEHLIQKYSPDIQGLKNFCKYIFKDSILEQIDAGIKWYERFSPLFDYAYEKINDDYYSSKPLTFEGIDIHYTEQNPKPNFLIELAKISLTKSQKDYSGQLNNFSFQQNITGLPTTIDISGINLKFADSFDFKVNIDHINENSKNDAFQLLLKNQKINELNFSLLQDWEMTISDGMVDKNFNVNFLNGKIVGGVDFNFSNTNVVGKYSGDNNIIVNAINSALQNITNFKVNVKIDGTTDDYDTSITSDLDSKIDQAVTSLARQEAEKVKSSINSMISDKRDLLLEEYKNKYTDLLKEFIKSSDIKNELARILRKLP